MIYNVSPKKMTCSTANPERDGPISEAVTIASGDDLDIGITIKVQSDDDESTKAVTSNPSSSDEGSIVQCDGNASDKGELLDNGLTTAQIAALKSWGGSIAKKSVPIKASPRVCLKRRFQPYPRRGSRRSAVTPLWLKGLSPLPGYKGLPKEASSQTGTAGRENVVEEDWQMDIVG